MLSYLTSSSSSSIQPQPLTPEQILKYKKEMLAVPASGALRNSSQNQRKVKRSVISKTYNTVASKPLMLTENKQQIYRANLRGEVQAVLTTSTIANTYYANSFSLSNFASAGEYTGLFDQYKFEQLEVWFEPQQSQSTVLTNQGELATCVDLDDATTPTTLALVSGKQNAVMSGALDGHYHRWTPHVAVALYSGAFTSFGNEPAGWIDVASPNVQHYGLKVASTLTSAAVTFNLQYRARVAFKQAGV